MLTELCNSKHYGKVVQSPGSSIALASLTDFSMPASSLLHCCRVCAGPTCPHQVLLRPRLCPRLTATTIWASPEAKTAAWHPDTCIKTALVDSSTSIYILQPLTLPHFSKGIGLPVSLKSMTCVS